jgi:hypothetical protein
MRVSQVQIEEIVLRHGPLEGDALTGELLECCTRGRDGLLKPRHFFLALGQSSERSAKIHLRFGPLEW